MNDPFQFLPYEQANAQQAGQFRHIFESTFPPTERESFDELLGWIQTPPQAFKPEFWGLLENDSVIGLAVFGIFKDFQAGYLAYLAVSSTHRGQGCGARLFEFIDQTVQKSVFQLCGVPARYLFWETVLPAHAEIKNPAELNTAAIRFYLRQEARIIPMDYELPAMIADSENLSYAAMVKTTPPDLNLTRQDALDIIEMGMVRACRLSPGNALVEKAIRSLPDETQLRTFPPAK